MGAHSVARALRWLAHPETYERYGLFGADTTVTAAARRWCERVERSRMVTR
jgi:hypothetical protein